MNSTALPPSCVETDGHLVELAYGEESAVPASAREHLASCDRCQGELKALTGVRTLAGALPMEEPSAALDAHVLAALDAHLAQEPVDSFLRLPEPVPEGRPRLTIVAGTPAQEPAIRPEAKRVPPRRRWGWGSLAAAAAFAVVAGGTWLVQSEGNQSKVLDRPAATAATPSPVKAAPAAPAPAEAPAAKLAAKDSTLLQDASVAGKELEKRDSAPDELRRRKGASPELEAPSAAGGAGIVRAQKKKFGALGSGGDLPIGAVDLAHAEAAADELTTLEPGKIPSAQAAPPPAPNVAQATETRALAEPQASSGPAAKPRALATVVQPPMRDASRAAPAATSNSVLGLQALKQPRSAEAGAPSPSRAGPGDAREREKAGKVKRESPAQPWAADLDAARAAVRRRDDVVADAAYARVLKFDVPPAVRQEALEARVTALARLGRGDQSDEVGELLTREFPSSRLARQAPAAATPVDSDAPALDAPAEPASKR